MQARVKAAIEQGCVKLGLNLSHKQFDQLEAYVQLLAKWNKVYNLTSIRDSDEMVTHHLLDSLAILPYLDGDNLLDVGSGGGLPGIPIALARPDLAVTLLDSNSKKTRFLQQAKAELGLNNVSVVHGRTEQLTLGPFSIVTARAFSTLENIVSWAGEHCAGQGRMLLMKGVYPEQELDFDLASYGFELKSVTALQVPGYDAQRHLVELVRI
jgi:16S rRNA (guanine527-N7)-methyltransferase